MSEESRDRSSGSDAHLTRARMLRRQAGRQAGRRSPVSKKDRLVARLRPARDCRVLCAASSRRERPRSRPGAPRRRAGSSRAALGLNRPHFGYLPRRNHVQGPTEEKTRGAAARSAGDWNLVVCRAKAGPTEPAPSRAISAPNPRGGTHVAESEAGAIRRVVRGGRCRDSRPARRGVRGCG